MASIIYSFAALLFFQWKSWIVGQAPTLLCNKGAEENSAAPCVRITEGLAIKQGLGTAGKCLLAPEGKAWRSSLLHCWEPSLHSEMCGWRGDCKAREKSFKAGNRKWVTHPWRRKHLFGGRTLVSSKPANHLRKNKPMRCFLGSLPSQTHPWSYELPCRIQMTHLTPVAFPKWRSIFQCLLTAHRFHELCQRVKLVSNLRGDCNVLF